MIERPLNEFVKRTNDLIDSTRREHKTQYDIHGDSYIVSILAAELIQLQDKHEQYKQSIRKRR